MYFKKSQILFLFFILVFNCDKKTFFAENHEIKSANWFIKDEAKFEVEVKDINQNYDCFVMVRNGNKYPFYNLYVTSQLFDQNNKLLAENLFDFKLSDDKTGKPFGSGIGDLFEHKFIIKKAFKFNKAGKYKWVLKQNMRQNPLPHIYTIGLIIEKSNTK